TQKELDQLASVTDTFNVIFAVNAAGEVFAAMPDSSFVVGTHLQGTQATKLLDSKDATAISGAFKGPADRSLSIISRPLFLLDGSYGGFVGGAVHLQNGNALQSALDKHHFEDGTYFYIVDETGTVVHHPEHSLIGSSFRSMEPVSAVLRGQTGTQHTT